MLFQELQDLPRSWAKDGMAFLSERTVRNRHPVGLVACEKRDRSNTGRCHAPPALGGIREHRRVRRKAAPSHSTAQAKLVQDFRVIAHNSPRQDLLLPSIRGGFVALQLPQHLECSGLT